MARRSNELFIGAEHLNIEGRAIKHPALIKVYATPNVNKISDTPLGLIGLDLETNHLTGELKLLGFWNGSQYAWYYNQTFIEVLFTWIRYCDKHDKSIAYWNRLDPFVLYKQFFQYMTDDEIKTSLEKFGKVGGDWQEGVWRIKPVTQMHIGEYEFGIMNVIRSSVQFYFYKAGWENLRTVWAYDIAQLYEGGLEKEATSRLSYYSKVDKSAHLVNWERFENDTEYQTLVLHSNELDSRAVYDLGIAIQNEFKSAFNQFPRTLISQGSLARAAIVASLKEKYQEDHQSMVQDIKSIGFINYYDSWVDKFGGDVVKDLYALSMEAYSGGQIETYMYGYSKDAYTADITSAYPSVIVNLYDLRGAKITKGEGDPPHIDYSYCFIRGEVDIPLEVDYHPLTVKHPIHHETNIRAVGEYRASYTIEERDFLLALGVTFKNEVWYNIETKGKLSPLAEVTKGFVELRTRLRAEGNSAQYMAKIAMNSIYGILYEAVDTYVELDNETFRDGYRAGEFFNPIYATMITSRTRITISKACHEIKNRGGKPILVMTDSLFWNGSIDMLPDTMWKAKKTLGYFEKPSHVNDLVCLGSGRYGYVSEDGYIQAKKRGLNISDIHDPDGVKEEFNWLRALNFAKRNNSTMVTIKVRTLISVGLVLNNHSYKPIDIGRVIEDTRNVDLIVGATKRKYNSSIRDAQKLLNGLIETKPIYLAYGMNGKDEINDQTLPKLRELLVKMEAKTTKEKNAIHSKNTSKTYYHKHKNNINELRSSMYQELRDLGYNSKEANSMKAWSTERLKNKLMEDCKI